MTGELEDLVRACVPQVLGALVRYSGDFDRAEDAVQEALVAATVQWSRDGTPDDPKAWLIRVASRRLLDNKRSADARSAREAAADRAAARAADGAVTASADDDSLDLFLLCCHPALSPGSQVALTLRAVGGLTTEQIARGLLVPTATMGQRISRAKATLRSAGATFTRPGEVELPARLGAVRQVLHLMFTEGHTSTRGAGLVDVSLSTEAIRLTRLLRAATPDDPEAAGLLALTLLTDARRTSRVGPDQELVPLADQDRSRWDGEAIAEGVALLEVALPRGVVGPFQLQGAIAAVHAEARSWPETDWPQIVVLYEMLERVAPSPVVTLNRAVAVAMVDGPDAGLAVVDTVADAPALRRSPRVPAVRAHLLERAGRPAEARAEFVTAARLATSIPEQHYLHRRAAALGDQRAPMVVRWSTRA